ncbi:MAG TPA: hypothetical protein VJA66_05635 [Thermoanaerobaculia bacterium]
MSASSETVWSRPAAVARLRAGLLALTDEDHSICQVAAQRGIFCHGFRRWNAAEFDRRWRSAIGRSTHLNRAQMEEFANLWQLAEQLRQRVALACDAKTQRGDSCRGWDEFSNADLARFCADVLGRNVEVVEHGESLSLDGSESSKDRKSMREAAFAEDGRNG